MINKCVCQHDYQDSAYGKNNRVHNQTKELTKIRCTVCGTTNLKKEETVTKKGK